jgi:hypothetical protein
MHYITLRLYNIHLQSLNDCSIRSMRISYHTTVQSAYSTPHILFANRHNKNKLEWTHPHRQLPFAWHLECTGLVEWNCPFENCYWHQSKLCGNERQHEITQKKSNESHGMCIKSMYTFYQSQVDQLGWLLPVNLFSLNLSC